ncbi:biotin--[acetyl-CoA-carboxylase] ligase [Solilutibacter silvestris]|uniref:Bifunctional ligase/repressor BirA n=1 Tax=Solilutibacter silvestris TaxID=1645665 RepID=A0A2K1Q299_9GAMM|nr:biotin--[acetyl-CoA-carboxylase] ligase [Lysobacter silvestris]PNS09162.1 biotin--[acetyl-CoA-carboxylase] ligase [Lysobacter silvestris]
MDAASPFDDRSLLRCLGPQPMSGAELAARAGQTRAAIGKRIQALRKAGLAIGADRGRGYWLDTPLDLLDADAIRAGMTPAARTRLRALDVAWRIDSTNTALLARRAADSGVDVLLAEQQTAGRGRRGRHWVSPLAAHLYLSVLRRFEGGLARLGGLSLVAGIAVAEALRDHCGLVVGLKWPNDLLVDGRKLGGILVEGGGEHGGPVQAVIGIGINVRMPATMAREIGQPWIDLASVIAADSLQRSRIAAAVLDGLINALDAFDAHGLAPFLERYRAFDVLAGEHIDVHAADGVQVMQALGLADDGGLRVRRGDGSDTVLHSGEVSVRRTMA